RSTARSCGRSCAVTGPLTLRSLDLERPHRLDTAATGYCLSRHPQPLPGLPEVVAAGDHGAWVGDLDAFAVAPFIGPIRRGQLDADRERAAGIVGADSARVLQRLAGAVLD